jgi:hypothetical protein
VEVRGYFRWPNQIHGDGALQDELLELEAETLITLDVGEIVGSRPTMGAGKSRAPTPGLRGLGRARLHRPGLVRDRFRAVLPLQLRIFRDVTAS